MQFKFVLLVMLNISQIPNKLYLAERFVQTSGDPMNQGIGTSVPENWRRTGVHMMFLIKGGGEGGGGAFEWGVEIFKGGLTPWKTPCIIV